MFTDFDGTLAPIVLDPATARPTPGAVEVLSHLAARFATVAVVSGRPAAFLAEHLGLVAAGSRLRAFGLYGLEQVGAGGEVVTIADDARWRRVIDEVAAELTHLVDDPTAIEEKGLGVVVHWRRDPEAAERRYAVAAEAAARHHLSARRGRRSVELVPPLGRDKGTVVRDACTGLAAACFLGDDTGDLPAFRALAELTRSGGFRGFRIAVGSPEAPAELVAEADLVVDGPPGAISFLRALAERAEAGS